MRVKDIQIGTRFGDLVVLSYAGLEKRFHATWNCLCDCGNRTVVKGTHLRRGKTKSCGCLFTTAGRRAHNFKDLSNLSFGRWVVSSVFEVRQPKSKKVTFWLCKCPCGIEKFVRGAQLVSGTSTGCKMCGTPRKDFGVSSRNTVRSGYIKGALDRGYSWALTDEQFSELTSGNCFYCGRPPSNIGTSGINGHFVYSGIDRVDNKRGYESDNVVSCCRPCNRAKDVMSAVEFLSWIENIHEHQKTARIAPFPRRK